MAVYKNKQLAEGKIKLPLHNDPDSQQAGYAYLIKYNNDIENVLIDSKLNPELVGLVGGDFNNLEKRFEMFSGGNVEGNFLVLKGGMPHMFTMDEAYLAIAIDGSAIYAAVLDTQYDTQTKTSSSFVRAYSNRQAGISVPPASMNQWISQFKDARVNWNYAAPAAPVQQDGEPNADTN